MNFRTVFMPDIHLGARAREFAPRLLDSAA
jgi:hypothetical protein